MRSCRRHPHSPWAALWPGSIVLCSPMAWGHHAVQDVAGRALRQSWVRICMHACM